MKRSEKFRLILLALFTPLFLAIERSAKHASDRGHDFAWLVSAFLVCWGIFLVLGILVVIGWQLAT